MAAQHIPGTERIADAGPEAPWIVMVHGVSQDHRVFSAQVRDFRKTHRLLLIDLPGHGLSAAVPGPFGLNEFAASVHAAVVGAGSDRFHFWGTHIGASAGLLLATSHPELFASLVLEAPVFPGRTLPAVSETVGRVAAAMRSKGIAEARRSWWEDSGWFAVMRARPLDCRADEQRAIVDDFQGGPWLDQRLTTPIPPMDAALARCEVPTLIMNGEHDMADFAAAAAALAALLPDCRRVTVPEAGGFPFWEFPDRVNQEVRAFITNLSGNR